MPAVIGRPRCPAACTLDGRDTARTTVDATGFADDGFACTRLVGADAGRAVRTLGRRGGLRTTDVRGTGFASAFFTGVEPAGGATRDRGVANVVWWPACVDTVRAACVIAEAFERMVDTNERRRPGRFGNELGEDVFALDGGAGREVRLGVDTVGEAARFSVEMEAGGVA